MDYLNHLVSQPLSAVTEGRSVVLGGGVRLGRATLSGGSPGKPALRGIAKRIMQNTTWDALVLKRASLSIVQKVPEARFLMGFYQEPGRLAVALPFSLLSYSRYAQIHLQKRLYNLQIVSSVSKLEVADMFSLYLTTTAESSLR
jgi:hypothetical protein